MQDLKDFIQSCVTMHRGYLAGDSEEERWAAEGQGWPFVQVSTAASCWQASLSQPAQHAAWPAFRHPLSHMTASSIIQSLA